MRDDGGGAGCAAERDRSEHGATAETVPAQGGIKHSGTVLILLGKRSIPGYAESVSIDPNSLPKDTETLRKIVMDLIGQLDREQTERHKIEAVLRELLDAKNNRKSERLLRCVAAARTVPVCV